ncbi:MAG: hypothetical protein ABSF34_11490, partial [Verrucomicrobiota bacterium]
FEMVKKKIDETNEKLDAMGARAALAFSNINANLFDAIRDEEFSTQKIDAYFKRIEEDAAAAKAAIEAALAITKTKDAATQDTDKGAEALALGRVKNNPFLTDDQKTAAEGAIRANYAQKDADAKKDENNAELKAAQDERDQLQAQLDAMKAMQQSNDYTSPAQKAQIDHLITSLPESDPERKDYLKNKADGTLDYSLVFSKGTADFFSQNVKSGQDKLGLDPNTGAMTKDGDAQHAKDIKDKNQPFIDQLSEAISSGHLGFGQGNEARSAAGMMTDDFSTPQQWQKAKDILQNQIDAANAPVTSDKIYLQQQQDILAAVQAGLAEKKKTDDAVNDLTPKVAAASAKVDAVAQTTNIKNAAIDTNAINAAQTTGESEAAAELAKDKGIADQFTSGNNVSQGDQARLIAVGSKIAGHTVDLATAATIIENGANNMGILLNQMVLLGKAMNSLGPNGTFATQLADLQRQIDNLKSRQNRPIGQ